MPEAAPSITRRALLRESAVLTALPAIAAEPASDLPALIARHKHREAAWLALDASYGDYQSPSQKRAVAASYAAQARCLDELLTFRPSTIEDARARTAYLMKGPWWSVIPTEAEITAFLLSLLPD